MHDMPVMPQYKMGHTSLYHPPPPPLCLLAITGVGHFLLLFQPYFFPSIDYCIGCFLDRENKLIVVVMYFKKGRGLALPF